MSAESLRPDVDSILGRLKGFQRATAAYAFNRLYRAPNTTRRFLVADEVGLGKTLVARGIVAMALDHIWDRINRIDIVYICSNASIARQNVNRLRLSKEHNFARADRLTLLATAVHDLRKHKVNFIAFTPGTSFDLRSSMGIWRERIVLYRLLQEIWPYSGTGALNLFQGYVSDAQWFRKQIRYYSGCEEIDQEIVQTFRAQLKERVRSDRAACKPDLHSQYLDLCKRFGYARKHVPPEDRRDQAEFIGTLRSLLARICVEALEPDIVILDEFQRFKDLLTPESEAGFLADRLFSYSDESTDVRLLLLSATPYKMYTLQHESQEDDHYKDFLETYKFLDPDENRQRMLERLLSDYRRELYRIREIGNHERLAELKQQIENRLASVMCRTERLRSSQDAGGMLVERRPPGMELTSGEVATFARLQAIAHELEHPQVIDYWKSAPYLFNLMETYKLKAALQDGLQHSEKRARLANLLSAAKGMLLDWDEIRQYDEIDPQNGRLRALLSWIESVEGWRLLWVPPSLPYYGLKGIFERASTADFTKRLIFSSWIVVPKTVSTLVSYDVERRIFRGFDPETKNTPEERRRRRPLLRFAVSEDRLTGMPILGILYPSPALAELGDPLALINELGPALSDLTLERVLYVVETSLRPKLEILASRYGRGDQEDEAWYWAGPILLDLLRFPETTRNWFSTANLASSWVGETGDEDLESRWGDHVGEAAKLLAGDYALGQPPKDLAAVLALMAVAGPAVVGLRSLTRIIGKRFVDSPLSRTGAAHIAWAFRQFFNRPETTALLRTDELGIPYWKIVLRYSAEGCLQAVLDEYVHLLRDLEGLFDKSEKDTVDGLVRGLQQALTLRTSALGVDEISAGEGQFGSIERRSLRGHFATQFGKLRTEEGVLAREDQVRAAFNSPFWPFVLTTTSIGQEGLDFHAYCHAVVHWNLPSNPVDLEQREGRVHRYKGHAVRKNVARVYGQEALREPDGDVWARMFDQAFQSGEYGDHGLVPYWVFTTESGSAIERHVPALPLSQDAYQIEALKRSLAVYRMVFGQPRQDDLMAYLLENLTQEQLNKLSPLLQIDLSPPVVPGS